MPVEHQSFEIAAIGHQGDGIAAGPTERAFVPFALPGERWCRSITGYERGGDPSPDRREPECQHFGTCGGCVAQHMSEALYRTWKRQILVDALQAADINAAVQPLYSIPSGTRRRLVMTAKWLPAGVALGFHERGSDRLVALQQCTVAEAEIVDSFPVLQVLAARLLAKHADGRLTVTKVDRGLDVVFEGARTNIGPADRSALADIVQASRILRLSINGDPVITRAEPELTIAGIRVVPPPGVFLQAAAPAESKMIECVVAATGKAKKICDLFSGLGTFTLPLSRRAAVVAIDSDRAALDALAHAARHTQGLRPIETRQRDLVREPLARKELDGFDAVVFDPPRAGAEAQSQMLAKSSVPAIVAVSCNPVTLARDIAILLDGGYELKSVTPIDQFLYSSHLEAVAVLVRPAARAKRKQG